MPGHPGEAAVVLVRDAASGALGVARIARRLRDGTVVRSGCAASSSRRKAF
ncbi:hypothetical protein ACH4GE_36110 [Streptomyces tendae]|uniref:hypothetical protein n=1 Tax=Streptomyces tendae TaxID=1932 RepID=UPI0037B6C60C